MLAVGPCWILRPVLVTSQNRLRELITGSHAARTRRRRTPTRPYNVYRDNVTLYRRGKWNWSVKVDGFSIQLFLKQRNVASCSDLIFTDELEPKRGCGRCGFNCFRVRAAWLTLLWQRRRAEQWERRCCNLGFSCADCYYLSSNSIPNFCRKINNTENLLAWLNIQASHLMKCLH